MFGYIASELTVCYGKSPFFMGKSTISMAIFNSKLLVHQAGSIATPNRCVKAGNLEIVGETASNYHPGNGRFFTFRVTICVGQCFSGPKYTQAICLVFVMW